MMSQRCVLTEAKHRHTHADLACFGVDLACLRATQDLQCGEERVKALGNKCTVTLSLIPVTHIK